MKIFISQPMKGRDPEERKEMYSHECGLSK